MYLDWMVFLSFLVRLVRWDWWLVVLVVFFLKVLRMVFFVVSCERICFGEFLIEGEGVGVLEGMWVILNLGLKSLG